MTKRLAAGCVRRQIAKLLGFHETYKGGRFARFSADFSPKSLSFLEKSPWPILQPTWQQAQFFPTAMRFAGAGTVARGPTKAPAGSATAKAMDYSPCSEAKLTRYLGSAALPVDNNFDEL